MKYRLKVDHNIYLLIHSMYLYEQTHSHIYNGGLQVFSSKHTPMFTQHFLFFILQFWLSTFFILNIDYRIVIILEFFKIALSNGTVFLTALMRIAVLLQSQRGRTYCIPQETPVLCFTDFYYKSPPPFFFKWVWYLFLNEVDIHNCKVCLFSCYYYW